MATLPKSETIQDQVIKKWEEYQKQNRPKLNVTPKRAS
jgi:hypothetical protein